MTNSGVTIAPGDTMGIIGGGQLGRMLAQAAARLGLRCHVLDPDPDCPAAQVATTLTASTFDDIDACREFSQRCLVGMLEFENIPATSLAVMTEYMDILAPVGAVITAQNRRLEKQRFESIDLPVMPWAIFEDQETFWQAIDKLSPGTKGAEKLDPRLILKTISFGYDGKGQRSIDTRDQARAAWIDIGQNAQDYCLEQRVAFSREISVIVGRNASGQMWTYPVAENIHANHILALSMTPARLSPALCDQAQDMARHLALSIDLHGIVALEMFVVDDRDIYVNEMAPRPHNSGHWSIEASSISQFEMLVRLAAGWPMPQESMIPTRPCAMINLLGTSWRNYADYLPLDQNFVHLYGKSQTKRGRKMGHVTRVFSDKDDLHCWAQSQFSSG